MLCDPFRNPRALFCTLALLGLAALLVTVVSTATTLTAHAGTLTVTNANDNGPGSLRQAISDALLGDTIDFALSYPATITLTTGEMVITKPLTITGPGPESLAVSGNGSSRVFRVDAPGGSALISVALSGLTIRGGRVELGDGGGLWNDEILTLSNVVFLSNRARSGGGLYNGAGGSATLTGVSFRGNAAQGSEPFVVPGGGGMCNYLANAVLVNVVFYGNWAEGGGGGLHNERSSAMLTNVTLGSNSTAYAGGGIYNQESNPVIQNSILWGNRASWEGDQIANDSNSEPTIAYCDVEDSGGSGAGWNEDLGTDLGGNLDADPGFLQPADAAVGPAADGDPRLRWGSPAKDAGDNSLVPAGAGTDLAGEPRIAFGVVDLGAYELQPGLYLSKTADRDWAMPGERVVYSITALNTFPDMVVSGGVISDALLEDLELAGPIALYPPDAGVVGVSPPVLVHDLTIQPGQTVTVTFPVTVSSAAPLGTISNGAAITSTQMLTPQVAVHHLLACLPGLTVTSDADSGPGSLRQAIEHVCPAGRVDFALSTPATVTVTTEELRIAKPLTIAGPGPDLLAISGDDAGRVLRVDEPGGDSQFEVTLSGLTIRDGMAYRGGGIWNDVTLNLTDLVFQNNTASGCWPSGHGGALYNERGRPVLTDVLFDDNLAGSGGGLYSAGGSSSLVSVRFSANRATGDIYCGGGVGAGIFNYDSSMVLEDAILERNWARAGGGIYNYRNSRAVLTNVAFRGNRAGSGGGLLNSSGGASGGSVVLSNVLLSGNWAAEYGGGMFTSGFSATLTNVSLSGNWAWERGGGIFSSGESGRLAVQNSILWSNRAGTAGDQIDAYQSPPATIINSDIEGSGGSGDTWTGEAGIDLGGNLDVDPRFVVPVDSDSAPTTAGDLHLLRDSPALNAGNNDVDPDPDNSPPDSLYDVPADLDGEPRIALGIVDMGAYEVQPYFWFYLPIVLKGLGP